MSRSCFSLELTDGLTVPIHADNYDEALVFAKDLYRNDCIRSIKYVCEVENLLHAVIREYVDFYPPEEGESE